MTSPLIIESRLETSCPGAVRAFKRSLGVEPIGLLPFTYASERCTKLVSLSACEKFHARDPAGEPTGQNRLTFPEMKTDATRRDYSIEPRERCALTRKFVGRRNANAIGRLRTS